MNIGDAVQYAPGKRSKAQQVGHVLEILSDNMVRVWWPDGMRAVLTRLLEPAEEKNMSDLPLFGKWRAVIVEKGEGKIVAEAHTEDGTVEYHTQPCESASEAHSALQYLLSRATVHPDQYPRPGQEKTSPQAQDEPGEVPEVEVEVGKPVKAKRESGPAAKKPKKKAAKGGKKKAKKPVKPVSLKSLRKW